MKTTTLSLERRSPIRREETRPAPLAELEARMTSEWGQTNSQRIPSLAPFACPHSLVVNYPIVLLLLCVFALLPLGLRAATNDLSTALQTGLFEEEANRNLPAAIEAYEKVAKQFDQNRALAATAIFRLGEVNRKLGKTNEAAAFYQRILREFGDQDTLTKLSQQNLAGMGMSEQRASSASSAGATAGVRQLLEQQLKLAEADLEDERKRQKLGTSDEGRVRERTMTTLNLRKMLAELQDSTSAAPELSPDEQELARTQKLIAQLRGWDLSQLRRLIPTVVPDAEFDRLNKQLRLNENFGESAQPEILKQRSELMDKLDKRSRIIMRQLEVRAEELVRTVAEQEKTKLAVDRALPKTSAITAVLDEEEAEIRRIQTMIQNSPDLINAPSLIGETPLGAAAGKGQLRVAKFLLEHGAAADGKLDYHTDSRLTGGTPLHLAAQNGHRAMVELLLQRGANVNAQSKSANSALHIAARNGFQSVADALVAGKADINIQGEVQQTPLHYAARAGHQAMVTFLIGKGANLNATAYGGGTALMTAAGQGHRDVLQKLLNAGAKTDEEDNLGRTALSYATEKGHAENVKALLATKADPNAGKVNLPLHCAIKGKSAGIVEALLKAGADANQMAKVTWRVSKPNQQNVQIVSSSYPPHSPDLQSVTPLMLAVNGGEVAITKLLLAHKADPNGNDVDGKPLIFSAVDDAELMKAFLDAGAKPNVREGADDSMRTPLMSAANPKVISLLLAAGADLEARRYGQTALLFCASESWIGSVEAAEALLKGGANVNARTEAGWTPLHFAAANKRKEMMELLLAHKADTNARDNQGFTPLDLALGKHLASGQGSGAVVFSTGSPPPPPSFGSRLVTPKVDDSVADLLREHGGLADLPKLDRIELVRPGSFQNTIFVRGTNDWNRFTLLDVIRNNYQKGSALNFPGGAGSGSTFSERIRRLTEMAGIYSGAEPPFPDLRRIVVIRQQPAASSKPAERITVDLLNTTNGMDCAKDIALNFGDVVEIPERLHTLQEPAIGLTSDELRQIMDCRKGTVTLVYQGKRTSLAVGGSPAEALIGSILAGEEARKALFSSADLARVKVTRRDSANAKPREWIVDCSNQQKAPDLWLRDGDEIEVPEKSPSVFDTDTTKARAGGKVLLSGEVKASVLTLEAGKTTSVLEAIVQVGTTDWANRKKVELQRTDPVTKQTSKVTLNVEAMTQGDRSNDVLLQDGDLILIPKARIHL